jgi:hypothetical protein
MHPLTRSLLTRSLSIPICLFMIAGLALAQEAAPAKKTAAKTGSSDAAYIARALKAAPPEVAKGAGVARVDKDGKMQMLRESKNGFTCMVIVHDIMCADANSLAFFDAAEKKQTPPQKLGITYMLRGDQGASNTDPTATKKTADNHWVVTGPHIMIVGAAVKDLGLPDSPEADPTRPYLMWANTPYAHAMIPVGGGAGGATAAKPVDAKDKTEPK